MSYIKLTNNVPEQYTLRQLRKDNPNVSFPEEPHPTLLIDWEVYPYTQATLPDWDEVTQVCEDLGLTEVGGVYSENYVVRDKTQEELATHADDLASLVRFEREDLLNKSDWTQIEDSPVDKTAWATYRQALREVPQQEGFPHTHTFPEEP